MRKSLIGLCMGSLFGLGTTLFYGKNVNATNGEPLLFIQQELYEDGNYNHYEKVNEANTELDIENVSIQGTWGTTSWVYDSDSGILSVSGGMINGDDRENQPWSTNNIKNNIKQIKFMDNVILSGNMDSLFYGLSELVDINVDMLNTSNVTNMSNMFRECSSLISLDVSDWDMSQVQDISAMFTDNFNLKILDVSKWNTANVTGLSYVFEGCHSLERIDVSNWDVSNVGYAINMFRNCYSVKELNVAKWNPQYFSLIDGMFQNTYSVELLDLSNWNIETPNFLYTANIFASDRNYTSLKTLKLSNSLQFPDSDELTLAPIPISDEFTGRWIRENPESPVVIYEDSKDFMMEYTGDNAGTYVWERKPNLSRNIIVKYQDEEGFTLAPEISKSGNVGESYTTEQKIIAGYTYKEVQGNPTGTFTEEEQTVTYVYTKNPVAGGTVTARYVDESGNPITENAVFTGNVGENYTTEPKIIAGYTYKEVQGNPTGIFIESEQTITYVYTKNPTVGATVTAKYVDENGNSILDSMIYTGNVGESYTTEQISIDGYTFVEVYGNPTGKFTEEEQTITYVYKKNKKETINPIVPSDNEQLPKKNEISYQKTLPKAGEKKNRVFTIVGVLLSSSLILFSFYKKKQTKKSI